MTTTTTGARLEHPIGAEGLLAIRMRSGDLRLRAVDGDTVRIRDRNEHDIASMFTIELGDGSASFQAGRDSDATGRRHGHVPDLDIELPRRATVVVETASAEIDVDGTLGDQRYRTASGDLALRGVSGLIAVEAVSGDVDVVAIDVADMTVTTVSGDVGLRAARLASLRVSTTSGDVKVAGRLAGAGPFAIETVSGDAVLAPVGDVRIEMATMSGDLHTEVDGRVEGARGHRSLSIGSGQTLVTYRSLSGDLDVVRPTPVGTADDGGSRTPARLVPPAPDASAMPPAAPTPSAPRAAATPPAPPTPLEPALSSRSEWAAPDAPPVTNGVIESAYDEARLRILRSLERGEIDVAEAGRRFEALDGVASPDPGSDTTRVPVAERSDG